MIRLTQRCKKAVKLANSVLYRGLRPTVAIEDAITRALGGGRPLAGLSARPPDASFGADGLDAGQAEEILTVNRFSSGSALRSVDRSDAMDS